MELKLFQPLSTLMNSAHGHETRDMDNLVLFFYDYTVRDTEFLFLFFISRFLRYLKRMSKQSSALFPEMT